VQNFCLSYLFCSHKKHKIENFINFELVVKKKIWANLQRIIELSTQKLSLSSKKYGFGIRDPEKTYPGSRGQKAPDPGSGSATLQISIILFYPSGCCSSSDYYSRQVK
jgi:hypothetical protein